MLDFHRVITFSRYVSRTAVLLLEPPLWVLHIHTPTHTARARRHTANDSLKPSHHSFTINICLRAFREITFLVHKHTHMIRTTDVSSQAAKRGLIIKSEIRRAVSGSASPPHWYIDGGQAQAAGLDLLIARAKALQVPPNSLNNTCLTSPGTREDLYWEETLRNDVLSVVNEHGSCSAWLFFRQDTKRTGLQIIGCRV